jgi:hypothetical protein
VGILPKRRLRLAPSHTHRFNRRQKDLKLIALEQSPSAFYPEYTLVSVANRFPGDALVALKNELEWKFSDSLLGVHM